MIMPNMRLTKNPMPSQDPNVRNKNFKEVTLGYTEEMALDEAQRCLNCKNMPCVSGCPVNIHIPEFIKKVAEGDFRGRVSGYCRSPLPCRLSAAVSVRRRRSAKASACAALRASRSASAVWSVLLPTGTTHTLPLPNDHRAEERPSRLPLSVPALRVLTCAGDLAKLGYDVTIFEALHTCRRRAGLRHPGVPSAEVHRAEGGR